MITKPTNVEQLKNMFLEMFLATTNKVTKVAPETLVNATGYGVAKVSQKVLKDIAILESHIFPESAFGDFLDAIALRNGIPARFGESGSSTYVRLVGDSGTLYEAGTHTFTGKHGVEFELEEDITIGSTGFAYTKVRSTSLGDDTNVKPLTLNRVLPSPPTGHSFIINEYRASGGRDTESDDLFRIRIMEGVNILATDTLARLEQVMMSINNNILRIYKGGVTTLGAYKILVSSVNGIDFSATEITELKEGVTEYLSLTEQASGIDIQNIDWYTLDVSARVEIDSEFTSDDVRVEMQIAMQKKLDYRFWKFGDIVEWDDLLFVAKNTRGVKRILDNYFFVNGERMDTTPPNFTLPRIRSFTLYDAEGNILTDVTGVLTPTYYPNQQDFVLQNTLL